MERRHFLKVAFGFAAGAVATVCAAKVAEAALLTPPQPLLPQEPHDSAQGPQPALATQDDLDQAHIEEVRWGRRRWGFRRHWRRRRFWGFRRRHWHRRRYWHRRRHWGWRRRHWGWHRRRWHRRFW